MNFSIFNQLISIIETGISADEDRELLSSSLFYYCCGKDPTPIVAFGDKYKLYIYSDILIGVDFLAETQALCERICNVGYNLQWNKALTPTARWEKGTNIYLSQFGVPNGNNFFLLFIQADA